MITTHADRSLRKLPGKQKPLVTQSVPGKSVPISGSKTLALAIHTKHSMSASTQSTTAPEENRALVVLPKPSTAPGNAATNDP